MRISRLTSDEPQKGYENSRMQKAHKAQQTLTINAIAFKYHIAIEKVIKCIALNIFLATFTATNCNPIYYEITHPNYSKY